MNFQYPIFGGSTGGWLREAQVEEYYAILWRNTKKQFFELPSGGTAAMLIGGNCINFARKEQALALGTQLSGLKIKNYKIFRIFPDCKFQYLHPKDGLFPAEKSTKRKTIPVQKLRIKHFNLQIKVLKNAIL